jgi:hypothetical protein
MATQVWTQTQDIELWSAWSLGQTWSNREDDLTSKMFARAGEGLEKF